MRNVTRFVMQYQLAHDLTEDYIPINSFVFFEANPKFIVTVFHKNIFKDSF